MTASTKKVQKQGFFCKDTHFDLYLAKREYEACQIILKFASPKKSLQWEMTEFKNEFGDTLECRVFRERYINVSTDDIPVWYPDALVPFSGGAFSVDEANVNYPFFIQVRSSPETKAGKYSASATIINNENGAVERSYGITATVWNFTLPLTPSCETAMGLDKAHICKKHGVDMESDKAKGLYKAYYEYLLSHKISAYNLPEDILSGEADKYMNDPRVTSFCVPYPEDDALLVKYYEKVTSNPVWASKAYFYPIDEPSTAEAYSDYCKIAERLNRLCPGYRMVTPFYKYKFSDSDIDFNAVEQQKGKSNILCPISDLYDQDGFLREIEERAAAGDKSWWYVCCGPKGKYCNLFIQWEGIRHRLLFWQQKSLKIDGLLYWSTTFWRDIDDVWSEPLTAPWTGNDTFGDGSLFYNGNKIGVDGPVPSLRLEAITDGIEDYEYLTIAEKLFGGQYVSDTIAKVSDSLTEYTSSDELFEKTRRKLGDDISEYYTKNR